MKKLTTAWLYQFILLLGFLPFFACNETAPKETMVDYYHLKEQIVKVSSIQDSLDVPWEIQYDQNIIWYSLQKGEIWKKDLHTGMAHKVLNVPGVFRLRTMGALGMAVDHNGDSLHIYLVYNQRMDTSRLDTSTLVTNLIRYTYDAQQDSLLHPKTILQWQANTGHNGSRIMIGQHNDLFLTTGDLDIAEGTLAQDTGALNGKVLHIMKDCSIPTNNPFHNYVWSYGHRNQQGICFGANGFLYASEHGDAIEDEVNRIEPKLNYGWPVVEGKLDEAKEHHKVDSLKITVTEPLISWTPTIAPAAIAYYGNGPIKDFQNSLLLVTLKGSALYVLHLDESGKKITSQDIYFDHTYGRLRSICVDDKGQVFLGTSNRDWNPGPGFPKATDDHILKITAAEAGSVDTALIKQAQVKPATALADKGKQLFLNYCASCHKETGEGLAGNFPPLKDNPTLRDNKKLLSILLHGRSGEQTIMGSNYSQSMPNFSFLTDQQLLDLLNYMKTHLVQDQPLQMETLKDLRTNAPKP